MEARYASGIWRKRLFWAWLLCSALTGCEDNVVHDDGDEAPGSNHDGAQASADGSASGGQCEGAEFASVASNSCVPRDAAVAHCAGQFRSYAENGGHTYCEPSVTCFCDRCLELADVCTATEGCWDVVECVLGLEAASLLEYVSDCADTFDAFGGLTSSPVFTAIQVGTCYGRRGCGSLCEWDAGVLAGDAGR